MKILFYVGLFLFFCSFRVSAQNAFSVKGSVVDTFSMAKIHSAAISVVNSKDSVLIKFGWTKDDGTFSVGNLYSGKFMLLITYPGYADYTEQFELDPAKSTHDFGRIGLTTKSRLLEEVVIAGRASITIKGDTTEFNAEKFKIEANSKVEDLLKQLPGITIDKDGKITAQGKSVDKVLVDGEEFFGDDPTLVTKNIRGDMVDKVQLFDKKSDQAAFTGIDDGQTKRTLNVVLKENKKNGYFGKTDVGGATSDFYQGQAMFNTFKSKQKASLYGTIGNTGKTGLSSSDNSKLGVGSSGYLIDANGLLIGGDAIDSYGGRYSGSGIPMARNGGAHFDSKWSSDKVTFNSNYKIGSLSVDGSTNTLQQTTLPGSIINSNATENKHSYVFRQKMDASYTIQFNPATSLKFSMDGTILNNENSSSFLTVRTRGDNSLLNNNNQATSNKSDQTIANASVLWNQKFKKAGRTISFNLNEAYNKSDVNGFLNTTIDYYNMAAKLDSTGHIDQYKTSFGKSWVLNTNMTYTEPFSKTFTLTFNYGIAVRNETSDKKAFNKSAGGNYDKLDKQFSNNFDLDQITNQAGAIFNYTKDKTVINFGTRVNDVNYRQTDLYTTTLYKRNYVTWIPNARYTYRFSQQKSFGFGYAGYTTQPRIDQIQPIKVNDDPLNIVLGNPNLKPSYRSTFNINYNTFKILSNQSFYMSASYSRTSNMIAQNRSTDAAGKTTVQAVNITDKTPANYSIYSYVSKKLKKSELTVGVDISTSGSTNYTFVNGTVDTRRNYNHSAQFTFQKNKIDKYNFYVYTGPQFSINQSSLQPQLNYSRMTYFTNATFTVQLPGNFEVNSEATHRYTEKEQTFTRAANPNPVIWNSTVSKKFFKSKTLKLSLTGSDLLNQNVGFTSGAFSQSSYTTIQRYFMCPLVWDFSKMGGITKPQ